MELEGREGQVEEKNASVILPSQFFRSCKGGGIFAILAFSSFALKWYLSKPLTAESKVPYTEY